MEYTEKLQLTNTPSKAEKFLLSLNHNVKHLSFPLDKYIQFRNFYWKIDEQTKICNVYSSSHKKKYRDQPLAINTLIDEQTSQTYNDSHEYVYGAVRSQILLPQLTELNEILIPIGLEFVRFQIDKNTLMLSFQIYNSYFYFDEQFTFFYDSLHLPIGLPIFDNSGQRLVGFVGERTNNGVYTISGCPMQSNKILLNPKDHVINIQTNIGLSEHVSVYGNMIGNNITPSLIHKIEHNPNDETTDDIKRVNIIRLPNGKMIINGTNAIENSNAKEIWAIKRFSTSQISYVISDILLDYIPVDIVDDIDVAHTRKKTIMEKFFKRSTNPNKPSTITTNK